MTLCTTPRATQAAERYALVAAGVVIVALTAAAFWLSYAHLAEVAGQHGLGGSPTRQWAWPATLDAFIVAGELLMLRAGLRRIPDWWAIALTATGSLGSIALNVAGVNGAGTGTVPLLDYVVAAVPPTAALLAFGVLMRQIHQHVTTPEPRHVQPAHTDHNEGSAHAADREAPRPHPATTPSDGGEPVHRHRADRHTADTPQSHAAPEADSPRQPILSKSSGDVVEAPEQVAEPQNKPEKPSGRKAAAAMDELLAIGRTAPLGRDGRVSRRKIEDAIRARRLPVGRERLDKITRRLQNELDKATADEA
ncbi:DUF2637 domain-containing protein [Streptomyces chitinivorans]|uniref:DUF2637 domain-containing protein n=1 Tax=Streptomyces chitinivorans TaxID=1257027 RepID=A0ABW7HP30_9ACTN|nr:DUF2637 domain-containing protein [Streptomyces chitinivorans]MDH2408359.1 DUF2637 domain-containing protein [Streptomyces chitinivorans]